MIGASPILSFGIIFEGLIDVTGRAKMYQKWE
jgi:hypothetical protein